MEQLSVTKLQSNIYRIQENSSFMNVDSYLVCGEEKAAVIDGLGIAEGLYECAKKLTDKPLCMIVTHGHPDHCGKGMQEFMEAGCDIYLSFKDMYMVKEMYGDKLNIEQFHDIENGKYELISIEKALSEIETISIDEETYNKVKNGAIIPKKFNNDYANFTYNNKIVAIYKTYDKDNKLAKPFKMFIN